MQVRIGLGLNPLAKLCPFNYSKHLEIPVCFPKDLDIDKEDLRQLTVRDPDSWSGMTMRLGSQILVVLNSAHARTRQVSTLMHELAHFVLKHTPKRIDVSKNGLLLLSDYDEEQEEEATWLSGALLLPREALWTARRGGQSDTEIALQYGVSKDLCLWRLRMTGVDAQLRASRAKN